MNPDFSSPTPGEPCHAPTVMVIEDDAPVRTFFIRALQLAGLEVVEAWSGEAALRLIRAGLTPDAVLLDLSMPGMGGWSFLIELRRETTHRSIPVAIITGQIFIPDDLRTLAAELGVAIHYKPVALEDLLTIANELIDRRSA